MGGKKSTLAKQATEASSSSLEKAPPLPTVSSQKEEASKVAETSAIETTISSTNPITSSKSNEVETIKEKEKEIVKTVEVVETVVEKEKNIVETVETVVDEDKLLTTYSALENRVYSLECIKRVKQSLLKLNVLSHCRFIKVPPEYYNLTMEQRAQCLAPCQVNQMCKSIVFENKSWKFDDNISNNNDSRSRNNKNRDKDDYTLEESLSDRTNSRYYLLVVQYNAKFNTSDLEEIIRNLRPEETRLARKRFNFQLADNGEELTGFRHNAVCPFGIINEDKYQIPVFLSKACMDASNNYIYMGGGAVDVKLGIPLNIFIKVTNAGIADVSQAR